MCDASLVTLLALSVLLALAGSCGNFAEASSDVHKTDEIRAPGCILSMEDQTLDEKFHDLESWGYNSPFWLYSRVINRAYADQHGYRFIVAKADDYATTPSRDLSWFKIRFVKAQLQCCCQWIFFINPKAYFRMDGHDLSIESWLHQIAEPTFFDYLKEKNINMATQAWFPQPPEKLLESPEVDDGLIALFARNGDNMDGDCGGTPSQPDAFFYEPGQFTNCAWGFINAGQFMIRNSTLTHKFLDEWFNDPSPTYYSQQPFEQIRVGEIAYKYKKNMIIVPFRELTGQEGERVRHYWGNEFLRKWEIRQAMEGLLTKMEAQYDKTQT